MIFRKHLPKTDLRSIERLLRKCIKKHNSSKETVMSKETDEVLKEFFENEGKSGFVTRLRRFLHEDFAHRTVKDFLAFFMRKYKREGKSPDFDPIALLPAIVKEVVAIQVESVKIYTQFLYEEALRTVEAKQNKG